MIRTKSAVFVLLTLFALFKLMSQFESGGGPDRKASEGPGGSPNVFEMRYDRSSAQQIARW